MEGFWTVLKRAFYGIYHSFSVKHMQLYLNEVCFRLNPGNVTVHTLSRISSFLRMCVGKRLTWKTVTA
ncbi:MAG: transposase [Holophagales bacterium]|nr:transposase [Holophagales bacterium]